MSSVPPVITPAPTPVPAPAVPWYQGIETKLAALATKLKTDEGNVVTWLKANWPHFVTWLGGALVILHKI